MDSSVSLTTGRPSRRRGKTNSNWPPGPLATFTGAGNSINLTNSLCAGADCITAGGLRFALRNGAVAANVTVTNPTPFVGAAGTVNVAPTAAHFLVSGSGSRVTLAP